MTSIRHKPRFLLPPVCALAGMGLMVCICVLYPGPRLLPVSLSWLGTAIMVGSAALVIWSARLFKGAGTTLQPYGRSSALVVTGPYRWTRNPVYLALVGIHLGLGILLNTVAPFLVLPIFMVLMEIWFIRPEEERLQNAFGGEYLVYQQRVRRWL